jgi:hypothetical protein
MKFNSLFTYVLNEEPNGQLQTSTNIENSGHKKEKRTSHPNPKTK